MDETSEANKLLTDIMEVQPLETQGGLDAPLILEDSTENISKDYPPVDQEIFPKTENTLDLFESEDIVAETKAIEIDEEENEIINSSQPDNENRKRKFNDLDNSMSKITKTESGISSISDRTISCDSTEIKEDKNDEDPKNEASIIEEPKILPSETTEEKSDSKIEDSNINNEKEEKINLIVNGEKTEEKKDSPEPPKIIFDKENEDNLSNHNLELIKENSLNSSNHVSPFSNLKEPSSTPNADFAKSPVNQVSTDTVSPDTSLENKHSFKKSAFYVEIIYDEKDQGKKEILHISCEDVTPCISNKRLSDVSSGILGDVSKSGSPNSVTSLQEPFALSNRVSTASSISRLSNLSRMSSSSTISTSSSRFNENFLVPNIPLINRTKDKNSLEKKITPEQLDLVKANWINAEKLFQILHQIDNNGNSVNVSTSENSPKTNNFDSGISSVEVSKINDEENVTVSNTKTKRSRKENKAASSAKRPKTGSKIKTDLNTVAKNIFKKSENNEIMTPTKTPKRSDTPSTDSSMSENPGTFTIGQSVFARWNDKMYYSGKILGYIKDQTWNVRFDDGGKKGVKEEFIIGNCHNLLKGVSVYAIIDKERNYDTGIVTKLWMENDVIHYEVMVDNGPAVVVAAPDIFLTDDQALCVKKLITHTPPGTSRQLSEVTLNNIVDGKRSTRSSRRKLISSKSRIDQIVPRKIITNETAIEAIPGVEPELQASTPVKKEKGPNKKKKLTGILYNIDSENVIETLGPIPEKGANLFKDLQFILVCVNSIASEVKKSNGSSSEADTDTEAMTFSTVPFDDDRLKKQIIAGGGKIYQHFEDIPTEEYSTCKLISNRPNKTAKYVQCLAAGMMLVCHEWIVRCCRSNKLFPFQQLPTGWSIEKKRFIESFQRTSVKPLQDCLVVIAPHNDKQFVLFWNRVCTLAGGAVTEIDSDEMQFQAATFVLGDTDCSERVVEQARLWKVPILSTGWIVQTLIHGEARGFDAHPSYSYDFFESDE